MMKYNIRYSCICDIGKSRNSNQDNFICAGIYRNNGQDTLVYPLAGYLPHGKNRIFGVFDGMGGEEHGEIASLLSAYIASSITESHSPEKDLLSFIKKANDEICRYAKENDIISTGTTVAIMEFAERKIALCNIGDSKIFRFSEKKLEQISKDHLAVAAYGLKPPLSQNLGIPPSELILEPYIALGKYHNDDIYLISSDGLTDMLTKEEITDILLTSSFSELAQVLVNRALEKGGKDNITVIICKVEKQNNKLHETIRKLKEKIFKCIRG